MLDVRKAYAESHRIIFNCNKTVCMTFKAKSAKSTLTPLLTLGGQYVKAVNHYKYLGIVLDTELSDVKDIQRQLDIVQQTILILCSKQAASLFFPTLECS